MTVPTLAESLEIVRVVLGVAFATATCWVALRPLVRLLARVVRRAAPAAMTHSTSLPDELARTSRAA